jgi:hypothetical protein
MSPVLPEDSIVLTLPFGGAVLQKLGVSKPEIDAISEELRRAYFEEDPEEDTYDFLQNFARRLPPSSAEETDEPEPIEILEDNNSNWESLGDGSNTFNSGSGSSSGGSSGGKQTSSGSKASKTGKSSKTAKFENVTAAMNAKLIAAIAEEDDPECCEVTSAMDDAMKAVAEAISCESVVPPEKKGKPYPAK